MSPAWLETLHTEDAPPAEEGSVWVVRPRIDPVDIFPIAEIKYEHMPIPLDAGQVGASESPVSEPHCEGSHEAPRFCPQNPRVNRELEVLHARIKAGDSKAQTLVDSRLMLCWLAEYHPELYRSLPEEALLLHPAVAHSYRHLPDIGRFVLQSLVDRNWKTNLLVNVICNSMPCLKRNRVTFLEERDFQHPHCTVLVNILHGLLLGLYPNTAKKPSFWCRVRLSGELRQAMTLGLDRQARFLHTHLNLLKLAMMEYVWFMCSHNLVTEREAICKVHGMGTFMEVFPNIADSFRQDNLQAVQWRWAEFNETAALYVERCVRTCKFRMGRAPVQRDMCCKWKRLTDEQLDLFYYCREMRCTSIPGVLWNIYSPIYPELGVEDFNCIEHLHSRCRAYTLPMNLVAQQCRSLLERYSGDYAQFHNVMQAHLCLRCCNKGNGDWIQSKLRLCMNTKQLICTNCNMSTTIVPVNMLGKILCIQHQAYYLCPICCKIRRWNFSGTEFTCLQCGHLPRPTKPPPARRRCCVRCNKTTNLEWVTLLNATMGVNVHVYLCSRHTLPAHLMRFVVDIKDFCRAVVAYDRHRQEGKGRAHRR